uniref:Uncharacterized protein n=1 Tax=Helianthus annuus TaxID=4232 RepID=A0A251UTU6_HELAN
MWPNSQPSKSFLHRKELVPVHNTRLKNEVNLMLKCFGPFLGSNTHLVNLICASGLSRSLEMGQKRFCNVMLS